MRVTSISSPSSLPSLPLPPPLVSVSQCFRTRNFVIKHIDLVLMLNNITEKPDDLKSSIEKINKKLGDLYELPACHEISKTQGSHYTSKFEVFYGLIRLALPRKQLLSKHAVYNSQTYIILTFRTNKLMNFIYVSGYKYRGLLLFSFNVMFTL